VFYPVVKFFEVITRGVVRLTGSSYAPPPITEEEIKGVIDQGLAEKALEKEEMELVHGALKFDDTVIRSVMTPRTKMFSLNSKMLLFEALPQINQKGFSRIPIYGENGDDIVGFIHVRDVLKELEKDNKMSSLGQIARKPVFASQEKMVSSLLQEMKGRKTHMAIVVDEHGMDIDVINEIFKTKIPDGDDYASLNGLLHEKLQDIPQEGDKVEIDNLRIIVEKVSKNVPQKIRIERI